MLEGQHALVTGGGTGIGLAIARALKAAGAEVTIAGRRSGPLEEAGGGLRSLVMDVAQEDSVIEGVRAANAHAPITICVANAGIAEGKSIAKTTLDFWQNMMRINLDGAMLTIRECLPTMKEAGWGRVLAISSIAGVRGLKGAPAYSASKHGMIGLIRSLSEDFMGSGITFNAICPGYVATPIVDRNVVSIAERAGVSQEEALKIMTSANPHGRLIEADEVAQAALWLCGPGSMSVNGTAVEIAGGQV